MPRATQRSFVSGEIAPTSRGQVGSEIYESGLRRAFNCYFSRYGTPRKRWGTDKIMDLPADASAFKLMTYTTALKNYLALLYWDEVLGSAYLTIWDTADLTTTLSGWGYGVNAVQYYTEQGVRDVQFVQPEGDLYFTSSGGPLHKLSESNLGVLSLERVGSGRLHGPICDSLTPQINMTYTVEGANQILTADQSYFQGVDISSLFLFERGLWSGTSKVKSPTRLESTVGFRLGGFPDENTSTQRWYGPWVNSGVDTATTITIDSNYTIAASGDDPVQGSGSYTGTLDFAVGDILVRASTPNEYYLITSVDVPNAGDIEFVFYGGNASGTTITDFAVSIYEPQSRVQDLPLFVQPTGSGSSGTVNAVGGYFADEHRATATQPGAEFVLNDGVVRFTDAAVATSGAYAYTEVNEQSDRLPTPLLQTVSNRYDGWPTALAFHEGRMYSGGFERHPGSFTGSRSGFYDNWTLGPEDADAVQVEISSDDYDKITWMQSAGDLLVGTERREYAVIGSPITPSQIGVKRQSSHGGKQVQARDVGSAVFFVRKDGRGIRSADFRTDPEGQYVSPEVTANAEHMFWGTSTEITEMHYMRSPEPIVFALRASGEVAALTYHIDRGIVAWSQWPGLESDSMAVSQQPAEDWIFFAGRGPRVTAGLESTQANQLLVMKPIADVVDTFMDYRRQVSVSGTTLTNELDLASVDVHYVDGGVFKANLTLDSVGEATVPAVTGTTQFIGVPIDFQIRPQSQEVSTYGGTSEGRSRKVVSCEAFLYASYDLRVSGREYRPGSLPSDHGADTVVTVTDRPSILNDWYTVSGIGTFNPDSSAFPIITSNSPYRFEVLAVVSEFEVGVK